MDSIAYVWPLLLIIPGDRLAEDIQIKVAVVELKVILGITDFMYEFLGVFHRCRCAEKKLVVILIQCVDVSDATESAIHDQLDFAVSEDIEFSYEFMYGLDVRHIAGEFSVVERQVRLFSEQ